MHFETYLRQDFPGNQYNTTALQNEIRTVNVLELIYSHIDTFGNDIYIYFTQTLNTTQKNELDNIVANHNMLFGIVIDPPVFETPVIELVDDISFSTPRPTALPSSNASYNNVVVLGQGGPDLSNVTALGFTWDLGNTQLNSFNFNTSNGVPGWWVNLMPSTTQSFASPNPDFTLQGTGVANLDGNYWINYYEDGVVFVSKGGTFSIFASNSSTELEYVPRQYIEKFTIINPITNELFASPNNFNVYGSEYHFIKSYDEESTTSSSYQTALTLSVDDLPNGNYKIVASHRYGITVTNNEYYSRLLLNGQPLGNEFISRENRNVNRKFNQFMFIETLEGNVTIDLQYRRGAGTAYISDMIIEIFKVN
jgi:hypothetical protein